MAFCDDGKGRKAVSAGFISRGEAGRMLDAFVRMDIDLLAF